MRMTWILLSFLILACSPGEDPPVAPDPSDDDMPEVVPQLGIRSGTRYGYCVGHCSRELALMDGEATFTVRSWNPEDPTLVYHTTLDDDDWAELVAVTELSLLEDVDEIVGCPDCADGGAEWVEIIELTESDRVVFDAGTTLPELAKVLPILRELRAQLLEESGF